MSDLPIVAFAAPAAPAAPVALSVPITFVGRLQDKFRLVCLPAKDDRPARFLLSGSITAPGNIYFNAQYWLPDSITTEDEAMDTPIVERASNYFSGSTVSLTGELGLPECWLAKDGKPRARYRVRIHHIRQVDVSLADVF